MTSGLCNPEYYKGAFLEIRKLMEVREQVMEVQEETVLFLRSEQAIFVLFVETKRTAHLRPKK